MMSTDLEFLVGAIQKELAEKRHMHAIFQLMQTIDHSVLSSIRYIDTAVENIHMLGPSDQQQLFEIIIIIDKINAQRQQMICDVNNNKIDDFSKHYREVIMNIKKMHEKIRFVNRHLICPCA